MSNANRVAGVAITRPAVVPDLTLRQRAEAEAAIGALHLRLGGAGGFLGRPESDLNRSRAGGYYRRFQGGSIYWSPSTGAHEIHGAIRDKWAALGGEAGGLGLPTTDETAAPDGSGRFNHFQGGSIYWSPATGAHEVHGAIRDKWSEVGWERAIGYPTTDEVAGPGDQRLVRFQRATIRWTPEGGAVVTSRVRIELTRVRCYNTEDSMGEDEFYVAGALTDGSTTSGILIPPIDINDGQAKPYSRVVFDADVAWGESVRGGLKAFDEDAAKDWSATSEGASRIVTAVSVALAASGNPAAVGAAGVLRAAFGVADFFLKLDEDDELGRLELDVTPAGPPSEDRVWTFQRLGGSLVRSDWSYAVDYRVSRGA